MRLLTQIILPGQIASRRGQPGVPFIALLFLATSVTAFAKQGPASQARPITEDQRARLAQVGPCHAVLPSGWQLKPDQYGQTADVSGPNGGHAAWGIVGVNPAMRAAYGELYGPPDTHLATVLSMMLRESVQFTSSQDIGGFFTAHEFEGANNAGVALYHVYPAPLRGQYIISEYFAWAPAGDPQLLSQAEAIMTSLQCSSIMRPPPKYHSIPHSSVLEHKKSTGSQEGDSLEDYNGTLGTQYAHDPQTGQVYYLDRSQMSDSGPEGPGYYVGIGVDRHRLNMGVE